MVKSSNDCSNISFIINVCELGWTTINDHEQSWSGNWHSWTCHFCHRNIYQLP